MKFSVLTLFPQILQPFFESSIFRRAEEKGLISHELVNIRDFAEGERKNCDDVPYGGGPGMVLKPEPVGKALDRILRPESFVIYPSPSGKIFKQETAERLSRKEHLIFLCGRYEGLDQRIIDYYVHEEISLGDYVLSSGETAVLTLIDAVYRLREGVLNADSLKEESHTRDGLLEYPHYTRPSVFKGLPVPEILLSGHHRAIQDWRREKSIEKTRKNRDQPIIFQDKD